MDRNAADCDTALFSELLYVGEILLKITVAAFVSAIEEDREHHRYRLLHGLVRADRRSFVRVLTYLIDRNRGLSILERI